MNTLPTKSGIIADCHTHIYPKPRRLYPHRTVTFSAADLIQRMNEFGVDYSGVLAHPPRGASVKEGSKEHDALAEAIGPYGERLLPWSWITPWWGSEGVREAMRTIDELGYRGFLLDPITDGFELDDPNIDPYCELAGERGVPVFVETFLEQRGAEPFHLVSLATRHPNVNFIMAHMGGVGLQQNMSGSTLASDVDNILIETSCVKSDPYAIFEGPARVLGAERVILGSNTPLHHVALNLLSLELTALSAEDKAKISGGNFLRLMHVSAPSLQGAAVQ